MSLGGSSTRDAWRLAQVARWIDPTMRVAWIGGPDPRSCARARRGWAALGIVVLVGSGAWTLGAREVGWPSVLEPGRVDPADYYAPFTGMVAVALGAAMLAVPVRAWWIARRTVYAVTAREVVAAQPRHLTGWRVQRASIDGHGGSTGSVRIEPRAGGEGDVVVGGAGHGRAITLRMIRDPHAVEAAILEATHGPRRG